MNSLDEIETSLNKTCDFIKGIESSFGKNMLVKIVTKDLTEITRDLAAVVRELKEKE